MEDLVNNDRKDNDRGYEDPIDNIHKALIYHIAAFCCVRALRMVDCRDMARVCDRIVEPLVHYGAGTTGRK